MDYTTPTMEDLRSGMKYLIADAILQKYGDLESFGIESVIATGKAWSNDKKIDFTVEIGEKNVNGSS